MAQKTLSHPGDNGQIQAQPELSNSRERLAGIIRAAMDAIITVDEAQNILLFNSAAEKVFGTPASKVLGKPLDLLIPERFRAAHHRHVRDFGETGITNRAMGNLSRLYGLRAGGQEFPMEASISQVDTDGGKLYTVILRDISRRIETEDRLLEDEQELRASFEQAAVGMAHISPAGYFLRVNEKLCEITGFTADELRSRTFREITHPEDLQADLAEQNALLSGSIPNYTLEKRYIRKNGQVIWVNLTVSLVRDKNGHPKYLIKLIEDITARKNAEKALRTKTEEAQIMTQQLWQTAKLATMGELAASVAHELNNPLAILSLRIESLLGSSPENVPETGILRVMEQEVERMASLVANLLQFSRPGQRQISSLDLREEIEKTLELINNQLVHRQIILQRVFAPDLPLVQADRQQVRQLLLNLVSNGSDAMPSGGVLTITAQPESGGKKVRIEIQDTGIGIPARELEKILEPFYTTKPEGKGTGLGLAICRRIVEEHHGTLTITSPGLGKGATVRIILPAANGSPSSILPD